jgi:heat shock 70kDa protein 1/2/6/8
MGVLVSQQHSRRLHPHRILHPRCMTVLLLQVLSTSGDTHLGGDDFDKRIVDYLANEFNKAEGLDLRKDRQALQRLTEAAEKAKIELSTLAQTSINLPFITATAEGPKHIDMNMSRAKFEEICSDLLDRCKTPVENSLRDAKLSISDIDEIILVGGSTRIPAVVEIAQSMSGKKANVSVNPDEVCSFPQLLIVSILCLFSFPEGISNSTSGALCGC